jgi:hypothetical protein
LVEHTTENRGVGGSIPPLTTTVGGRHPRPGLPDRDEVPVGVGDVRQVVLEVVTDLNLQLPSERRLAVVDATPVLAAGSVLDSLATLNLLVGLEERCERMLGLEVELLGEDLLADADGPLATLGSITAHLEAALEARG